MAATWAMATEPGEDPRTGLTRIVNKLVSDLLSGVEDFHVTALLSAKALRVVVEDFDSPDTTHVSVAALPPTDCRADLGFTRERLRAALVDPLA